MKKLFFIFAAMLTVVLVGCKKGAQDAEPEEIKLAVDPSSINSPAFGADYALTLTAPEAWTASCADSWIKVNPTSGNAGTMEIRVKISANKESAESNSKIVFKSGDKTLEVPVKRAAKDPARLKVSSETDIKTPKDGGSYTIMVESNIKWQISSNASWANIQGDAVKRDNANVTVIVDPATKPEETTATITIKPFGEGTEAGEQTVTITRGSTEATSMNVDKSTIKAPATGGSYAVSVTSNAKWRVTKSWEADWIELGNTTGDGNGAFTIDVSAATSTNKSSTIITVTEERSDNYEPVSVQIYVEREGKAVSTLSVTPDKIDAPSEGGTYAVAIQSNYPWQASLSGTKIFSVSITSGTGNETMIVTVKPTTSSDEQTGTIVIKTEGGDKHSIHIRREGAVLYVAKDVIEAECHGTSIVVKVTANLEWTASSSDLEVAKVSPTHGKGDGSVTITVPASNDSKDGTANVVVQSAAGHVSRTIKVKRQGVPVSYYKTKAFSVAKNKQVYFASGNIQYDAKTLKWSFADHQYTAIGFTNGVLDLFGWGTGDEPMNMSTNSSDYNYIKDANLLQGIRFEDWGSHQIYDPASGENYTKDMWETMSAEEWDYVFNKRTNASTLHGLCGLKIGKEVIKGVVLLPDEWALPTGLFFAANKDAYLSNVYTANEWTKMERNGAVFLPAAGSRYGETVKTEEVNNLGYYWTSSLDWKSSGSSLYFDAQYVFFNGDKDIQILSSLSNSANHGFVDGHSVRLVHYIN